MHEPRLLLGVVCSLSLCRCKWPPCLISKKNLWLSLFHPVWRRYFTDIVEDKRLMHRAIPMTSIPYPRFLSLLSPGFRCLLGGLEIYIVFCCQICTVHIDVFCWWQQKLSNGCDVIDVDAWCCVWMRLQAVTGWDVGFNVSWSIIIIVANASKLWLINNFFFFFFPADKTGKYNVDGYCCWHQTQESQKNHGNFVPSFIVQHFNLCRGSWSLQRGWGWCAVLWFGLQKVEILVKISIKSVQEKWATFYVIKLWTRFPHYVVSFTCTASNTRFCQNIVKLSDFTSKQVFSGNHRKNCRRQQSK